MLELRETTQATLWLTGLPCAGKTTLARRLKEELDNRGYNTVHLDGDNIRGKLNADLGFSPEDRRENLRRAAHVSRLFNKNNHFVIASFVSPLNELREMIRGIIDNFKLVYVKCSLRICEQRDTKGMYKKARQGNIEQFTGVSAPFEDPGNPEITVNTDNNTVEECVGHILEQLKL